MPTGWLSHNTVPPLPYIRLTQGVLHSFASGLYAYISCRFPGIISCKYRSVTLINIFLLFSSVTVLLIGTEILVWKITKVPCSFHHYCSADTVALEWFMYNVDMGVSMDAIVGLLDVYECSGIGLLLILRSILIHWRGALSRMWHKETL